MIKQTFKICDGKVGTPVSVKSDKYCRVKMWGHLESSCISFILEITQIMSLRVCFYTEMYHYWLVNWRAPFQHFQRAVWYIQALPVFSLQPELPQREPFPPPRFLQISVKRCVMCLSGKVCIFVGVVLPTAGISGDIFPAPKSTSLSMSVYIN